MPNDTTVALILTTEADQETAALLARTLVEQRVAACVTATVVRSTYRWEGRIEEGGEVQLLVKTTVTGVDRAVRAIEESHSYDVPEIVVLEGRAASAYGSWVAQEVAGSGPSGA